MEIEENCRLIDFREKLLWKILISFLSLLFQTGQSHSTIPLVLFRVLQPNSGLPARAGFLDALQRDLLRSDCRLFLHQSCASIHH